VRRFVVGAARASVGRRAGFVGEPSIARLREQIGQLASRRLWRQNVGTHRQSRPDRVRRR
jgi:hypothetical protein